MCSKIISVILFQSSKLTGDLLQVKSLWNCQYMLVFETNSLLFQASTVVEKDIGGGLLGHLYF